MPKWFAKKKKKTLIEILKFYFDENRRWKETEDNYDVLVEIVSSIRPKKPKTVVEVDLFDLITFLTENKSIASELSTYLTELFSEKKISKILTDAAILQDAAFFHEVKKRAFAKILPFQHPVDSLEYVLSQVFYSDTDPIWINKIPQAQIEDLYD
ncbi:MAG: recombinase, partial [Bacteroidetes bacterium HGW-Bacteroidetes-23]